MKNILIVCLKTSDSNATINEGDLLLKTISSCLKKHFRKTDIYRIGGDEIVIIVKNIAEYLFISKTKDMLTSISNTPYSVSIGVIN